MSDQLGLFGKSEDDENPELNLVDLRAALSRTAGSPTLEPASRVAPRRAQRVARVVAANRRKRRLRQSVLAVVVLLLLAGGVVVGFKVWRTDATAVPDFAGSGSSEVVVRVQSGDVLGDIADTLVADKVVASSKAFVDAAANNADIKNIRPGYYKVKTNASGAASVAAITNPLARVGMLRLIPGQQLADVAIKTGGTSGVKAGYLSDIVKAACVPLNGVSNCFTAAQLLQAEETADPVALGVVNWAVAAVQNAPDPTRRLEGMLVPGDYNVPPGADPVAALQAVVSASAANWNATGIVAGAKALGQTPYDVAVVASLIEREGNATSMGQVSRVTYNRLAIAMKLQFDSTVAYALGLSSISTTNEQRRSLSPYNTYVAAGLPPTPITSPGVAALNAALNPVDGNWLYFVEVDLKGNFCFSLTYAEHSKCVTQARAAGVFG